jgi:C-terminal processing protease CtpA/Prc
LRTKLKAKGYDAITSRKGLAETVTADLQAINKDGHLGLRAGAPGTAPNGQRREQVKAIARSGWLADGVAYLEFRIFNGGEADLAQLKQFIADHSSAKTLIIDVRRHYGGGMDEMDVLLPALFSVPTPLLQGDARAAVAEAMPGGLESTPEFFRVSAPAGVVRHEHRAIPAAGGGALKRAKIYLLVSRDTVSAGEHLALALKRTGRATLIGQTTRGAGNFGRPFKLPHNFSAFVPFGRTFDPDTGQGWEGTGVRPDIEISPELALDEALKLAGLNIDGAVAASKLQ